MTQPFFDRNRLSPQESAVFELAIEGLTDIQIAQRLDIKQSTVNSYWVRVRGKLGQLSRTELVALALKQKSSFELDAANVQIDDLRIEAQTHAQLTADHSNAEIYHAALEALPEGLVICGEKGVIRYTNRRLEGMFGFQEEELLGRSLQLLVPGSTKEGSSLISKLGDNTHPLRFGFNEVAYGRRKNGTQFRIAVVIDSGITSTGPIFSVIVRDFSREIDTRRSLATAWEVL